jgi:replication factor C small subunit
MWVEKYRPRRLSDVLGQENIINRLQAFVKEKEKMPHFLFAGPAGVGKTSSAIALAREIFGSNFSENYKELNASDERGIKIVREDIKNYASIAPTQGAPFRILVLDEADNMTTDAQQALRRTMEKYKRIRFILIANYSSKIISPIQSRTAVFRFRPIAKDLLIEKIKKISELESIKISESALDTLYEVCHGDLRQLINIMQACSIVSDEITVDIVNDIAGKADPKEVRKIISLIVSKRMAGFKEARKKLRQLLFTVGISGKDLIGQINQVLLQSTQINDNALVEMIKSVSEIDFRLNEGANEEIQLTYLLSQFIWIMDKYG